MKQKTDMHILVNFSIVNFVIWNNFCGNVRELTYEGKIVTLQFENESFFCESSIMHIDGTA